MTMGSRFYGWSAKVYGAPVDERDVDWMELGRLVRERAGMFDGEWLGDYDLDDEGSLRNLVHDLDDDCYYIGLPAFLAYLVDGGARVGCFGGGDCVSISCGGAEARGGYVVGIPAKPAFPWTAAEPGGACSAESVEAAIRAVLDRVMPEPAAVAEYDLEFVSFG